MNKNVLTLGFVFLLIAVVGAAGILFLFPYEPSQPPKVIDTDSTPEGIQQVVNANNQFSFELLSEMSKTKNGNMFYSPYSLSAALAMTYEGARGQTADEMKSVFHFPETNVLRSNFAAIYNEINKKDKPYQLSTGNALWVQQDYPFLEEYLSTVEKYYGGKAAKLDFKNETEKSRQTINQFIEAQTNDKIKDLIAPGILNADTRLVLTNAIYFKGTWLWEFDKTKTSEQDFKVTPDITKKVPMMRMNPDNPMFNYAQNEEVQIIELPYKGEEISMLVILPADNLNAIESTLTPEKLSEWKSHLKEEKLDSIYLPKFEFKTTYMMNGALSEMGMPAAFSSGADFSGMDGSKNLSISAVIHQAFVKVDEEGTEAAAATAVVIGVTAALPSKMFRADHPFIFIIQEKKTGNILFMGKIVDPTA